MPALELKWVRNRTELWRRLDGTGERVVARGKPNPHVGSDVEELRAEEGRLEGSTALAVKRVLASEIDRAMKHARVSQAELARRMKTSRAVVHRLLDASDGSVTLATINKAATALGRTVRLQLRS